MKISCGRGVDAKSLEEARLGWLSVAVSSWLSVDELVMAALGGWTKAVTVRSAAIPVG